MAGDREIGDETRNQMMQNLFGEQSEEEEEEEEVDSEHEAAANHSDYQSDDVEGEAEHDGEAEAEAEGEGEAEGQGEVEVESEGEAHDVDHEQGESEGERVQSSPEKEISEQPIESEGKDAESEEEYGQRVATSRRREVIASESEGSGDNHYAVHDHEDEEVDQTMKERSPEDHKDDEAVRKVFGDSDEDEDEYFAQNEQEQGSHRSPMEEDVDAYDKDLRPEDMVPDEDAQYESEDEHQQRPKEKPVGPPLELEIPLRLPPGRPDRMNMIRVSNIMGIEPKPFDPKTYVEEDVFVTDESGTKKRIRLEDNIVRWRTVKNRDGRASIESNARFVKWSDGSMQLLIGNEVLNLTVQEALHDQTHLFLRHGKGILQSQGRLLRKMRFMPSSLTSKSHRLLTALVDSRHKKVYKVKNCITDIDPEREKEEKEKVEGQTIRANELLHRKREKVKSKYTQPYRRERQLSPGFLEDGPEEEDEADDYYSSRRASARHRFEEDLEAEAQAEKRIINAKRSNVNKGTPRKTSLPAVRPSRRPVDSESEREESEYETDGEDIERSPTREDDGLPDEEDEYEDDEEDEDVADARSMSEGEEEEPRRKKESGSGSLKRKEIESDEDSPPRKAATHRRKAVVFDSDED